MKSIKNHEKTLLFWKFSIFFLNFFPSKSCRKSKKMIFGRFFHFSPKFEKSIFPFRNPAENPPKIIFEAFFFTFQKNFKNSFFPWRNCLKSLKKWILGDFFNFKQNFQSAFFPFRNPTENLKRWFSTKFLQHWTFTRFLW